MENRTEFVREVTLRICSSLKIDESLERTYLYLKEFFPLEELYLSIIDHSLGAIRRVAFVTTTDNAVYEEITPLTEEILAAILEADLRDPFIATTDYDDPFLRSIAPLFKLEGHSELIGPLWIDGERVGGLLLRVSGEGRYALEHLERLTWILRPFAIALANALAHEAVIRYRDILIDDKQFLHRELHAQSGEEIIGSNSGLRNVMEMVSQVAPLNNTVLLLGETGTGKELVANLIHFSSPRKDGPFIKVNCGAIPEHLIDSELFGHERGAFTGAVAQNRGRFERAEGGTIFLDEIGELPLSAQVRLLRVLQNREVERVGGSRPIPVNIRVIAATHRSLDRMVTEGRFREDLLFRLNGFPIIIPPVRQRKEDVPALIRHFVAQQSSEFGMGFPPSIAPGALNRLMEYNWPGNVRELENLVVREMIRHRGGPLTFDSVLTDARNAEPAGTQAATHQYPLKLDDAMAAHISHVLKLSKGKIHGPGGAAELLDMNPNTLRWRINKLGIIHRR